MKISELIELLKQQDPDMHVIMSNMADDTGESDILVTDADVCICECQDQDGVPDGTSVFAFTYNDPKKT